MEVLLILFIIIICAILINVMYEPKLDRNTETGEVILWYNDMSAVYIGRKHIVLWKDLKNK